MRILYSADLHIGRQLHGFSLAEEHQVVLDQIVAALAEHQPDLFIIADDIFDRPIREHGIDAKLLFVSFLNDANTAGLKYAETWEAAFAAANYAFGLPEKKQVETAYFPCDT